MTKSSIPIEERDKIDAFIIENYQTMMQKDMAGKFGVTPSFINNRMTLLRMDQKIGKKIKRAPKQVIEVPTEPEISHGPEGIFEVKYSVEGVQSKQKLRANSSGDAMKRLKQHLEKKNPDYIVETYSAKRMHEEGKEEPRKAAVINKEFEEKKEAPGPAEVINEYLEKVAPKFEAAVIEAKDKMEELAGLLGYNPEEEYKAELQKKEVETMEAISIEDETDKIIEALLEGSGKSECDYIDINFSEKEDDFYTAFDSKERLHIAVNGQVTILDPAHTIELISYIATLGSTKIC